MYRKLSILLIVVLRFVIDGMDIAEITKGLDVIGVVREKRDCVVVLC